MSRSNADSSGSNNQHNKNDIGRGGRGQSRGRGGRRKGDIGYGISLVSSYIRHKNRKKGSIKDIGNNGFEVTKS